MEKIKNGYALDMSQLVNQLRVKAGVMEIGERIAWGIDTALMREAADKIEALEALCLGVASQNNKLRKALYLAKEMFIANDMVLPNTFEVIDDALNT